MPLDRVEDLGTAVRESLDLGEDTNPAVAGSLESLYLISIAEPRHSYQFEAAKYW
jgi:hypothetical protein